MKCSVDVAVFLTSIILTMLLCMLEFHFLRKILQKIKYAFLVVNSGCKYQAPLSPILCDLQVTGSLFPHISRQPF